MIRKSVVPTTSNIRRDMGDCAYQHINNVRLDIRSRRRKGHDASERWNGGHAIVKVGSRCSTEP